MANVAQREVLFGLYEDETILMDAVHRAQDNHLEIMDVYTPFPVHGLDHALHLKESRLHAAGFIYGALGTLTAFLFMTWVFTSDWPMIFGGKPYFAAPSFIPITFEVTVLFAAIGMTVTFYTVCGMAPGVNNPTLDDRITDDKFCIAFDTTSANEEEVNGLRSFFNDTGAVEVNTKLI
jgi:hypothetical protein